METTFGAAGMQRAEGHPGSRERQLVAARFEGIVTEMAMIMETTRPAARRSIEIFATTYAEPDIRNVRLVLTKGQSKSNGRLAVCEARVEFGSIDLD